MSADRPKLLSVSIDGECYETALRNLCWSCQAVKNQDACAAADSNLTAEWSFSFGNGFVGTEGLEAEYYVTAYFPGCDHHDPWKYQEGAY